MIVFKKEILKFFAASIFSLALLLPSAVQLLHTFEGHEHKACTEVSTHLHEKQLDCSIDSFHFSFFNLNLQTFAISKPSISGENKIFTYKEHSINSDKRFVKLRGPPIKTV